MVPNQNPHYGWNYKRGSFWCDDEARARLLTILLYGRMPMPKPMPLPIPVVCPKPQRITKQIIRNLERMAETVEVTCTTFPPPFAGFCMMHEQARWSITPTEGAPEFHKDVSGRSCATVNPGKDDKPRQTNIIKHNWRKTQKSLKHYSKTEQTSSYPLTMNRQYYTAYSPTATRLSSKQSCKLAISTQTH